MSTSNVDDARAAPRREDDGAKDNALHSMSADDGDTSLDMQAIFEEQRRLVDSDACLSAPDDGSAPRQGRGLGGWYREVAVPSAAVSLARLAVHRLETKLLFLPFGVVCVWAFGVYGYYVAGAGIVAYYCRKSYLRYCEPVGEENMPL